MDLAFIQSPEFPNWLARQEGETLAWLAERIALREAPMWFDQILRGYGYPSEPRFTPLLRSLISMGALRRFPGEAELQRLSVYSARVAKVYLDTGGAFYSAASVLDYQTEGDFNHHNAAYSAYESSGHGGRWCIEEVLHDVMSLAAAQSPTEAPLWRAGVDKAAERWATVAADWRGPDSPFSFWARWYQAALEGTPMDPELLRDIALIPDDIWEAGPEPVAVEIAKIEEKLKAQTSGGTALSNAALFDFDFDAALKRLEIIGFHDDMAHLKNPAMVQAFLDDIEEVQDGLQDFLDYSEAARNRNNTLAILGVATEKILDELKRTKDKSHIRARRVIALSGDLFTFSTEETKRAELGEGLCRKLDANIALLRSVCRKHLAVAILQLAPLDTLSLHDNDPAQLVVDLKAVLDRIKETADGKKLAKLSPEARAVMDDLVKDLETLERALKDATGEGQRKNLWDRFVRNYGALAATTGKALEKANKHAEEPAKRFDQLVRVYKRWETIKSIMDWVENFLNGGSPPM